MKNKRITKYEPLKHRSLRLLSSSGRKVLCRTHRLLKGSRHIQKETLQVTIYPRNIEHLTHTHSQLLIMKKTKNFLEEKIVH